MHAAHVLSWGSAPQYVFIPDEPAPPTGFEQLSVLAFGLANVVRSRASGKHYTSKSSSEGLPYTPGVDGVGRLITGPNVGKLAYFNALNIGKSFQTILNISAKDVFLLPEAVDPIQVAGLMNPGLGGWMALQKRLTSPLPKDFTAVILGGSSFSGRVSVGLLRHLGAKKVVGVARSKAKMEGMGYDVTIQLAEDASKTDFGDHVNGVDLVLDFLFAAPGLALIEALPPRHRTQYVHIGSAAGYKMELNYDSLRNKDIVVTGSGLGSWTGRDVGEQCGALVKAMESVKEQKFIVEKFEDVERVWKESDPSGRGEGRVVFITENYEKKQ
ncbi:hypothetical protein MMC10_002355 [Thelotrema lepadinum]|nr:hypothetical protein [Thelotrema lepadinum]